MLANLNSIINWVVGQLCEEDGGNRNIRTNLGRGSP